MCDRGSVAVEDAWVRDFLLDVETYRGLDDRDDHLAAGTFEARLEVGEALTVVASAEQEPETDGVAAYAARRVLDAQLIAQSETGTAPQWVQQLTLAADQFIVRRPTDDDPLGRTVIAGYHWFGDWGRDTMISLPGLTLATGRPEEAAKILRTFARLVDQGMLPNRLPEAGTQPEYNTVDATLWYFEAVRATYAQSGDTLLLRDLFPVLRDIVDWHLRGTRYHIKVDERDGLLFAGEKGVQLTWMDAKIGDWVVTPRTGKPVEVNALWYNALCSMVEFARILDEPDDLYQTWATKAKEGFARFWNAEAQMCYDVIDGPDGDDASLRPNQLLAVSLHHSPLDNEQARAVVDGCARHLLTSYGLRSLSPDHADYAGHYGGNQRERDSVYHQGTVWGWLMGPFVAAHLRVYGDREEALDMIEGMARQLGSGCAGSLNEIYDGDPPFMPRGAVAQAWSVGEALRVWKLATEAY